MTFHDWSPHNAKSEHSLLRIDSYLTTKAKLSQLFGIAIGLCCCSWLTAELEPEFEISSEAWKFETLDKLPLGREAARGVAKGDIIIIAASRAGELPSHARNWIETWLPQKKNGPTALVVLLDQESESVCKPSPFCVYLRQVAEGENMDFFCNANHWTLRDFSHTDEIIPPASDRVLKNDYCPEPAGPGFVPSTL